MKKNILYLFIPFCIKSDTPMSFSDQSQKQTLVGHQSNESQYPFLGPIPIRCSDPNQINLKNRFNESKCPISETPIYYSSNHFNESQYQFLGTPLYCSDQKQISSEDNQLNELQRLLNSKYIRNNVQNSNQLLAGLEKYYSILSENFNALNNKVKLKKIKNYNDCYNWKSELFFLDNQFMLLKDGVKDLLEIVSRNPSELEKNYSNSILTSIENRTLVLESNILKLKGKLNNKIIKLTKENLTKSQSFFSKIFS